MASLHFLDRQSTWKVSFPLSGTIPLVAVSARVIQRPAEHDILEVDYQGRIEIGDALLASGDPVQFEWSSMDGDQVFTGYVHHVKTFTGPTSAMITRVVCIAASYVFKETRQKIYKKATADGIVRSVAQASSFGAVTQRHPRVFKAVGQSGQSDWQLLRRLAKQTGYALRAEGANVTFVSKEKLFYDRLSAAPTFKYLDTDAPAESAFADILSFEPIISDEAPDLSGARVNRKVGGVLENDSSTFTATYPLPDSPGSVEGVNIE